MDQAESLAGSWWGGICLGNCRISVSKQCPSCCDLQLGSMARGEVSFQRHTCDSSRLLGQGAWQPGARARQAAAQERRCLTPFYRVLKGSFCCLVLVLEECFSKLTVGV